MFRPRTAFQILGVVLATVGVILLALVVVTTVVGPWYCPAPPPCGVIQCHSRICFPWALVFVIVGPVLLAFAALAFYLGMGSAMPPCSPTARR